MDEIRRLEQEIRALQAQLRQQSSEAARARQQIIDNNKRALEECQADMRRAINSHDKDTQAEYERLLSEYKRNLSNDIQLELAKMDVSYQQLLEDVKRSEAELLRKNQELEQAIAAIRSDISKRNAGSSQEAKNHLISATQIFHSIETKPHEKFTPKRLQIFYNAIKDGQQLYKAGLFEATTAVAISAKSGLERLGYTIDDNVVEWDQQFDLFQIRLRYLQAKMQQELIDWESLVSDKSNGNPNKRKAHLIEINYWSRGEFASIVQAIKKHQRVLSEYQSAGKEAYLKQPSSVSIDELKEYISEIEKLDERLSAMSPLYKQRYTASCERADWGEAIIDFLTEEINLVWLEKQTGFKEASEEALKTKDFADFIDQNYQGTEITQDTREWLKLVFINASENHIYIYILPIEAHGKVTNRIIIHIDYDGPDQKLYSHDIYQHVCEAIQYDEESEGIVNYAPDVNELKLSDNKAYSETGKDLERMKQKF